MENREKVRQVLTKLSHECYDKGVRELGLVNAPELSVIFECKGKRGGQAAYWKTQVDFNMDYAVNDLGEFTSEIVVHEVAHVLAYLKYGKASVGHTYQWAHIMYSVFNVEPRVHHHMELKVNTSGRSYYNYQCANAACGKTYLITSTMHNKMQRGQKRICGDCRCGIVLVEEVKKIDKKVLGLLG